MHIPSSELSLLLFLTSKIHKSIIRTTEMVNELNNHKPISNNSQTLPISYSTSTQVLLRNIEPTPPPMPSILLKSSSTFNCSDDHESEEKKTQCKFVQFSYAFKRVFVSFSEHHRIHRAGFLCSRSSDHEKNKLDFNRISNQQKKLDQRNLNSETFSKHLNSPSIKFAPLPKIKNRPKKSNTISMGVAARSQLIQQMKKQEEDLARPKRFSLPIQEPVQWTNNTSKCITKSEKRSEPEDKLRRRQKNQESEIKGSCTTQQDSQCRNTSTSNNGCKVGL